MSSETSCVLCGKVKDPIKRFNLHHINYEKKVIVLLCFNCHQLVHGRKVWHNSWEKLYGKTWFNEFSKKFREVYEERMK
ncbi:MAG: hypothetical protein WC307_05150 [Candidatus Nanoarchaeia archaeon]|jgi:hypothetical protein